MCLKVKFFYFEKASFCASDLHRTCTGLAQDLHKKVARKAVLSKRTKSGLKSYDFSPLFVGFRQNFGLSDTT